MIATGIYLAGISMEVLYMMQNLLENIIGLKIDGY